jgi:hypothetical protein
MLRLFDCLFENEMMGSRSTIYVLVSLLATTVLAAPAWAAPECASYGQQLVVMQEAVEAVRSRVDYLAPPEDAVAARHLSQLALVERDNTERLGALLAACGWPRRSSEGLDAARRAWLVAQQSSDNLPFQRQVVRQLELAVLDGEASVIHLATASDRLAVKEGQPQRYGTQLHQVDGCAWDYYPLDDLARVEGRRKRLGLPPLASYKRAINEMIIKENCLLPRG